MAIYRVQVTMQTSTGVPADRCVNTFWMDDDDVGTTMLEACKDDIVAFYDDIEDIWSAYTPKLGHMMDFYKQSDPEPRSPAYSSSWSFTNTPSGAVLPLEVACVMSYQGAPSSGVNQQTRRNRVFLGPLSNIVMGTDGRFDPSIPPYVRDGGDNLLAAAGISGWEWVAFSTKLNTGVPVTNGWVDNEPDTQRRRGRDATSRSTWA